MDEEKGFYIPNTILNEDIRKLVVDGKRVVRVYRKDIGQKKYTEIVYEAKNIDCNMVNIDKEIVDKIFE